MCSNFSWWNCIFKKSLIIIWIHFIWSPTHCKWYSWLRYYQKSCYLRINSSCILFDEHFL
jgi:hypothetical protein